MDHSTPQEKAWSGEFGNDYVERNSDRAQVAVMTAFFATIFRRTGLPGSVLELGANVGLNLEAIHGLSPKTELHALEINPVAVESLRAKPYISVHNESILEFKPSRTYDFVFTRGVLIHIAPDKLPVAYDLLYRASSSHLMVAEYYNPTPVEVPYRGNDGLLFKRDFAGEILDRHKDTRLDDYGFVYRGDPAFPQDDITWFLMSKK